MQSRMPYSVFIDCQETNVAKRTLGAMPTLVVDTRNPAPTHAHDKRGHGTQYDISSLTLNKRSS